MCSSIGRMLQKMRAPIQPFPGRESEATAPTHPFETLKPAHWERLADETLRSPFNNHAFSPDPSLFAAMLLHVALRLVLYVFMSLFLGSV